MEPVEEHRDVERVSELAMMDEVAVDVDDQPVVVEHIDGSSATASIPKSMESWSKRT